MTEKENLATCMAARADATAQRASVLAYGGGSSGLARADTTQADVKLAKVGESYHVHACNCSFFFTVYDYRDA